MAKSIKICCKWIRNINGQFRIVFLLPFILVVLAAVSCNQNFENQVEETNTIQVNFSTSASASTSTSALMRISSNGCQWVSGDSVGIFMLKNGGSLSITQDLLADNLQYKAIPKANASQADFIPTDNSQKMFYPLLENVDFIAYYPYQQNGTGNGKIENYVYSLNLSNQSNQADIDLIYSNNATGISRGYQSVNLNFRHTLAKLYFTVEEESGKQNLDFSNLNAKIIGMPVTAKFNLESGDFSDKGTITDFIPATISKNARSASIEALVLPQMAGEFIKRKMLLEIDGSYYIWSIPDNDIFESGGKYYYTITVKE
jgi:endonuclease G